MKTLPAKVWNGKALVGYTDQEADYWHMLQTLTGDAVDGYKGCPGIGPVGAEKLLNGPAVEGEATYDSGDPVLWPRVVAAYEKKKLTEEDALRNARLARILRWDDWDRKKKEPILWSPQ
jgi:DNA polymerase-1